MEKISIYETLENNLNLIRAIKARLINVIVTETQRPPELDANGKAKPRKLSDDYYKAVSELQRLMPEELQLIRDIGDHELNMTIEAPEELFFDERGELQIRYPASYKVNKKESK